MSFSCWGSSLYFQIFAILMMYLFAFETGYSFYACRDIFRGFDDRQGHCFKHIKIMPNSYTITNVTKLEIGHTEFSVGI